jgi:hypothetical protein
MRALVLAGAGILGLVGLTLPAPATACDVVCVMSDNYEAMLRTYMHVLVGRVEPVAGEPYPTTFVAKPVRLWKGGKKEITLASNVCSVTPRANRPHRNGRAVACRRRRSGPSRPPGCSCEPGDVEGGRDG